MDDDAVADAMANGVIGDYEQVDEEEGGWEG